MRLLKTDLQRTDSGGRMRLMTVFLMACLVVTITACKGILDVELPTRVPAGTLDDPALASTLVQGAVADFECAYSNYVAATGLLTDELVESTGFIAWFTWDQRRILSSDGTLGSGSCTSAGYGLYTPLHTARFQAADAYERIQAYADDAVPSRTSLLATAAAYEGYAITLLGEGFCSIAIDAGPELTRQQSLAKAEERFSDAIQLATTAGNSAILNMALVGRARVRMDLGKGAEAIADAELVPEGFVYNATYSSVNERRRNQVFVDNQVNMYVSVDPRFRALEVDGVIDSRVPTAYAGRKGNDGATDLWLADQYTSDEAPIPIATWNEAQLILAEAKGGQDAVDAINRLRDKAGLPLFSSSDATEIAAQVREERRRELFLTGHRLNDMLRFELPFDTGVNAKGIPYGETTCLPLPDVERSGNPNFSS